MTRKKGFLETFYQINVDLEAYRQSYNRGVEFAPNQTVKTKADYDIGLGLFQYLVGGKFLTDRSKVERNAKEILLAYDSKETYATMQEKTSFSLRQLRTVSNYIEDYLEFNFPLGLQTLWKDQNWKTIKKFLVVDDKHVNQVRDFLDSFSAVADCTSATLGISQRLSVTSMVQDKENFDDELLDKAHKFISFAEEFENSLLEQKDNYIAYLQLRKIFHLDGVLPFQVKSRLLIEDEYGIFQEDKEALPPVERSLHESSSQLSL